LFGSEHQKASGWQERLTLPPKRRKERQYLSDNVPDGIHQPDGSDEPASVNNFVVTLHHFLPSLQCLSAPEDASFQTLEVI
jgi:hypothetical protein